MAAMQVLVIGDTSLFEVLLVSYRHDNLEDLYSPNPFFSGSPAKLKRRVTASQRSGIR